MISTIFTMFHINLGASVDPQTAQLIQNLENILLPILYAIAGGGIIFACARFGLKIHFDPENKGRHIKHLVWSIVGLIFLFASTGIANIIFAKLLGAF